ncbi:CocE/NonD family hydrolase, partial [Streptomyces scabiei]|uniref:CocE/NonD family hydrolase n=1 Tax=Streptomyces scabiei TaxID=1930 RepID=UPI0038F8169D
ELEARADVLTFTSEPLGEDLEIIGEISAQVWVRADRPSADVFVRLCDVDERGRSWNVTDDLVRIATDSVTRADLRLAPTAYRFAKGHRLRIQVSGGAFPRFARNLG